MRIVQVVEVYGFLEVSLLVGFVLCCAPAPPPKPKPKHNVSEEFATSLIFNTEHVKQIDTEFGYNNSWPGQSAKIVGEKRSTDNKTEYYFTGSHDRNWLHYLEGKRRLIMTLTCGSRGANSFKDMCVCVSDNECYRPDSEDMTASLAPFCSGVECNVYMFATGPPNSSFVKCGSGDSPSEISVKSQFVNGVPKLLPSSYLKIKSISCKGCKYWVNITCPA